MKNIYFLYFAIAFSFLVFLSGCNASKNTKENYCQVQQLLLQEKDYPPDTIFDQINSPIDEEPKESVSQTVYYRDSWIGTMAIKYISNQRAQEAFSKYNKMLFSPDEIHGLWEKPVFFPNKDAVLFDNYEVACGDVVNLGNRCIMIGQYQEYFISYIANISSNSLTKEMFADLVTRINDRLNSCLNQ